MQLLFWFCEFRSVLEMKNVQLHNLSILNGYCIIQLKHLKMVSFMSYLFKYILTLMNLTKIREGRKKKWDYKNIPPPKKKKP